ncbi:zf-HC2 domain-containing protein [Lysobacter terrae]
MSGHVFPFSAQTHDEAQRLLPWLANGTLEAEERTWLERHLEACEICREELQELQGLRSNRAAAAAEDAAATGNADAAWRKMRRKLTHAQRPPAWGEAVRMYWRGVPAWFAGAVAAQVVLMLALGVLLYRAPPAYHTLTSAPSAARASGNLIIVFDPQLNEARMRRLLAASSARIVDGPNDAGAYVLAVPPARIDSVRDALRAAPGVVMVENLSTAPSP